MFVFPLPEIGEGVVEGEIVRWLVSVGDSIATDQPVCEIMTDKATVEISSPKSGKVAALHGKPGDVVKVHAPLLEIEAGAGAGAAPTPRAHAPAQAPAAGGLAAAAIPDTPRQVPLPPPAPVVVAPAPNGHAAQHPAVLAKMPPPPGQKALASPAVRHAAREAGIDIDAIPGSGKNGRVTRADLDVVVAHPAEAKAPPALPAVAPTSGDETIKIIGLRRKIAEQMTQSYRTIPHFTYVDEVDASKLVAVRNAMKGAAESQGVKLSYLPFIMKALAACFREFPSLNATMDENQFALVVRKQVNIGIATDTPAGLFVPVVHDVAGKSLLELAAAIQDLTARTRNNQVKLDELKGGTFTITSVGNIGGRFATPIINHPEVAILGVNQVHDRPVAVDGRVEIRPMMYLSPSFDHRVIDGAVAARFVSALKARLEAPETLFLEMR
jgi:pyruvate dehydrogenase E2 component (dihydrolipoamide acetyltransferase)